MIQRIQPKFDYNHTITKVPKPGLNYQSLSHGSQTNGCSHNMILSILSETRESGKCKNHIFAWMDEVLMDEWICDCFLRNPLSAHQRVNSVYLMATLSGIEPSKPSVLWTFLFQAQTGTIHLYCEVGQDCV